MFTLPFDTVYKNIFTLILIILFIFFFSSDPSWNQSFFQKNGLTSIFVILLIYLVYHNFNLSLYFIPFFLLYLIYSKNILQSLKNHFYSSTTNILPTIQEIPSTNQLLPNIEEEKSTEILELKEEIKDTNLEEKVLTLEDLQELYFSIKNELDELEENDKKS
jgi:Ca2+/Na+ antiporter